MCPGPARCPGRGAQEPRGDAGRGGEAVGDAAGSVPPRDPVAAQQRGGLRVAVQGGQPRVDAGVGAGRRSAAADRDAVVVQGPQHRLDGAVQVRGDLRGAPPPVRPSSRGSTGPAAAGPRPPAHPDTSGLPASDAPPPRPGSSQRRSRPPGANPHLVDRVDHVDRRDRGPMVTGRRGQRRPPPLSARAAHRSTAAASIGRPGAAPPWYSGDPAGHPAPGRVVP